MSSDQELNGEKDLVLPHLKENFFKPGNSLWRKSVENRIKFGGFSTPEVVLKLVCEYFAWVEDTPIQEAKLTTYEGSSNLEEIPKMRAPTRQGLAAFLGIHVDTWSSWARGDDRRDLTPVAKWADQVMYDMKYTGAAAGQLNPMMIARDLGLVDHQKVDNKTTVVIDGDEAKL